MTDYLLIIKRNLLSPIVLAILLLAGALVYVREYRDAWFISVVIIVNSLIGIVQEIRAKRALKKLELMNTPRARVVKNGEIIEIPYRDLKVGDEIELMSGDEVPADAIVAESRGLELDESMLTGESATVAKQKKDVIYAATTVMVGSARAVVEAVGDETKAGKISKVLKHYRPEMTPLQKAIQTAISVLTFGAIGLALLIFIVYYFSGQDSVTILKTITSAAVTVVPEGLLLASSLLLAFGALRLAQAKVLPQKLSAIEAMALLNLLCVDKTGTLTSDEIGFDKLVPFDQNSESELSMAANLVSSEASSGNATGEAIKSATKKYTKNEILDIMAFSSVRKMSAVRSKINKATKTLFMGAPESIDKLISLSLDQKDEINTWTARGQRVLLVAEIYDNKTPLKDIDSKVQGKILGAVVLNNNLRDGVKETIDFLQSEAVTIKVISGDNPKTVEYIAAQAGINNPTKSITGVALAGLSEKQFAKAADEHTIFARVLPEQKEQLIAYFEDKGNFTGMVGDGVNDALALKKADLGVAMFAGAASSRKVADIILLNNSFNSLPLGMKLGNRIMQAIEIIASLFFHKIIYGIVLLVTTILLGVNYPFEPRHITFMNIFLVTMPTLMWTLFPPNPKHRINPNKFWQDTLLSIAPIAVITGLTVAFTYWVTSIIYPDKPVNVATVTVMTATFFGVYMVFLVAKMLGVTLDQSAKLARIIYLLMVSVVSVIIFGTSFLRDFFDFSTPTIWILWPAIGVIALAAAVQWQLAKSRAKRYSQSVKI